MPEEYAPIFDDVNRATARPPPPPDSIAHGLFPPARRQNHSRRRTGSPDINPRHRIRPPAGNDDGGDSGDDNALNDARDAELMEDPTTPIRAAQLHALTALHRQMQEIVNIDNPISRESFCKEVTLLARLSLVSGDYQAAVKAYTVVGQHLGALRTPSETHQHLHMHNQVDTTRPPNSADFARATDVELRRIMLEDANAPIPPAAAPAVAPAAVQARPS